MVELENHAAGVLLPVRAHAGARANAVRGEQNGELKVAVTQVAEKGKANKAIVQVLCKTLKLQRSQVELVAGATSSHKKILVRAIGLDELARRIEAVLTRS